MPFGQVRLRRRHRRADRRQSHRDRGPLGSAEEQPTVEGADDLGVGRLPRSWRDVDPPALLEPADLEHADRPTVAMTRTREESRRVRPVCAEHIAHERPDDDPAPAVEAWLADEVVEADGLGVAGLLRVLVVGADLVALGIADARTLD